MSTIMLSWHDRTTKQFWEVCLAAKKTQSIVANGGELFIVCNANRKFVLASFDTQKRSLEDDAPNEDETDSGKRYKRIRDSAGQLKKAPQAPKRFKSSYICFFMAKRPLIKQELGDNASMTEISKRSAEMWYGKKMKDLSAEEKEHWEHAAAKDKERYLNEKASYTGPWQVPTKRAKKDPSAPKRPMSAFLYYALGKRTELKKKHPDMVNTDVSRLLGEMWRTASSEIRKPYIDKEKAEREKYKVAMTKWKQEKQQKDEDRARQEVTATSYWQAYYHPNNTATDDPESPYQNAENMMYMASSGSGYSPPYPFPQQQYGGGGTRKQPVILGANGMPVMPFPIPPVGGGSTTAAPQPPPTGVDRVYPDSTELTGGPTTPYETTENFEFPPEPNLPSPDTTTTA
eukprot:scaffold2042_cov123-Cylindrotheca_fusiformis.AAC.14